MPPLEFIVVLLSGQAMAPPNFVRVEMARLYEADGSLGYRKTCPLDLATNLSTTTDVTHSVDQMATALFPLLPLSLLSAILLDLLALLFE